jgi:hypothetical protein
MLGAVTRHVSQTEGLAGRGLAYKRNEADADGYATGSTLADEGVARNGFLDIVCDSGSFIGGAMLEEDAEFITAEPRHRVAPPYARSDEGAQLSQQLVSCQVPTRVIDSLESVQVQEADNVFCLSLGRASECPTQPLLELRPVHQPGERVMGGTMGQSPGFETSPSDITNDQDGSIDC